MKISEVQSKITKLDKELNFGGVGTSLQTIKTYLTNAEQTFSITNEQVKIANQERFIRILQEEKAKVSQ
jgi:hypothetical protein